MPFPTVVEAAAERVAALQAEPRRFGPYLEPCACGAPRHEHSGPTASGQCQRTGCRRYRRDAVDALVEEALLADQRGLAADLRIADRAHTRKRAKRKHEGTVKVSASDSSSCRRSVQYRERPPADLYLSPDDKRAAFVGTLIHDAAMRVRKTLYPWRKFEQPVQIPGLGASAYDSYDPIMAKVDDTKTAGDWKWDHVTDFGPPASEWRQVLIYGLALVHQGLPVRTVQITYLQRKNGHDQRFERPFDREEAEAAVAYLTTLATQIELGIEQPRDEPGPGLSPLCTRYCPFRDYCWGVPEAEAAGRHPRSWTLLGPDPEDERIAEVLRLYRDAQQAESAHGKAKKEHKASLEGLPFGEYGDLVYKEVPRKVDDMKAYLKKVIDWAEADPATRGDFDDITVPTYVSKSIRVGPVPKAEQERRAREAARAEKARQQAAEEQAHREMGLDT